MAEQQHIGRLAKKLADFKAGTFTPTRLRPTGPIQPESSTNGVTPLTGEQRASIVDGSCFLDCLTKDCEGQTPGFCTPRFRRRRSS